MDDGITGGSPLKSFLKALQQSGGDETRGVELQQGLFNKQHDAIRRDDEKGLEDYLKVSASLDGNEVRRYENIFGIFKRVVFPPAEAEILEAAKKKPVDDSSKLLSLLGSLDKKQQPNSRGDDGLSLLELSAIGSQLARFLPAIGGVITAVGAAAAGLAARFFSKGPKPPPLPKGPKGSKPMRNVTPKPKAPKPLQLQGPKGPKPPPVPKGPKPPPLPKGPKPMRPVGPKGPKPKPKFQKPVIDVKGTKVKPVIKPGAGGKAGAKAAAKLIGGSLVRALGPLGWMYTAAEVGAFLGKKADEAGIHPLANMLEKKYRAEDARRNKEEDELAKTRVSKALSEQERIFGKDNVQADNSGKGGTASGIGAEIFAKGMGTRGVTEQLEKLDLNKDKELESKTQSFHTERTKESDLVKRLREMEQRKKEEQDSPWAAWFAGEEKELKELKAAVAAQKEKRVEAQKAVVDRAVAVKAEEKAPTEKEKPVTPQVKQVEKAKTRVAQPKQDILQLHSETSKLIYSDEFNINQDFADRYKQISHQLDENRQYSLQLREDLQQAYKNDDPDLIKSLTEKLDESHDSAEIHRQSLIDLKAEAQGAIKQREVTTTPIAKQVDKAVQQTQDNIKSNTAIIAENTAKMVDAFTGISFPVAPKVIETSPPITPQVKQLKSSPKNTDDQLPQGERDTSGNLLPPKNTTSSIKSYDSSVSNDLLTAASQAPVGTPEDIKNQFKAPKTPQAKQIKRADRTDAQRAQDELDGVGFIAPAYWDNRQWVDRMVDETMEMVQAEVRTRQAPTPQAKQIQTQQALAPEQRAVFARQFEQKAATLPTVKGPLRRPNKDRQQLLQQAEKLRDVEHYNAYTKVTSKGETQVLTKPTQVLKDIKQNVAEVNNGTLPQTPQARQIQSKTVITAVQSRIKYHEKEAVEASRLKHDDPEIQSELRSEARYHISEANRLKDLLEETPQEAANRVNVREAMKQPLVPQTPQAKQIAKHGTVEMPKYPDIPLSVIEGNTAAIDAYFTLTDAWDYAYQADKGTTTKLLRIQDYNEHLKAFSSKLPEISNKYLDTSQTPQATTPQAKQVQQPLTPRQQKLIKSAEGWERVAKQLRISASKNKHPGMSRNLRYQAGQADSNARMARRQASIGLEDIRNTDVARGMRGPSILERASGVHSGTFVQGKLQTKQISKQGQVPSLKKAEVELPASYHLIPGKAVKFGGKEYGVDTPEYKAAAGVETRVKQARMSRLNKHVSTSPVVTSIQSKLKPEVKPRSRVANVYNASGFYSPYKGRRTLSSVNSQANKTPSAAQPWQKTYSVSKDTSQYATNNIYKQEASKSDTGIATMSGLLNKHYTEIKNINAQLYTAAIDQVELLRIIANNTSTNGGTGNTTIVQAQQTPRANRAKSINIRDNFLTS